jgi:CheY-like chemotaxis protein
LVEDEEDVLRVLKAILTSAGFDVTPAANGDQALEIFRSQLDFDLLLTDISMPGKLNGIALAAQTRTIRPDLPVVFLSGYAGHNCAPDDGMSPNDIRLTKPARKKDLIQAIEQTLDLPVSTAK